MKLKLLLVTIVISCLIEAKTKKVLFIGIDGCRADVMMSANIPNIKSLINHSIYSLDGLCTAITYSGNGWSTMLTGVWHTKHNVEDNNFTSPNFGNYPDFITRAEAYNPSLRTMSLVNWHPINDKIIQNADVKSNLGSDIEVKTAAVNALHDDNPDILFVDFDEVDHAGHTYGYTSTAPQYVSSIQTTDSYIGEIVNAMKNRPTYNNEDWLVVLTTDHGAIDTGHGGGNLSEINIFTIYSNPGFVSHQISKTILESTKKFNQLSFSSGTYAKPVNQSLFNFGTNQDFTIEFWVKPLAPFSGDPIMIGNKNNSNSVNKGFVISGDSGDTFKINIGDGINKIELKGGKLTPNKWKHIAVSFARNNLVTLYEDGVPVTFSKMGAIGNIDSGFPLTLNQYGNQNFTVSYKDIRIWKSALPGSVITKWANKDITSSHPYYSTLLTNWKCNEPSGNLLYDASMNGNNMLVTGSPTYKPNITDVFKIYDYTLTTRETDHFPTVLNWMCIPVQSNWGIDGINRIPLCTKENVTTTEVKEKAINLTLYPNPTSSNIYMSYRSTEKRLKLRSLMLKDVLFSQRIFVPQMDFIMRC